MAPMRTLCVDTDSFLASVEQRADPALRGRTVAVTALDVAAGAPAPPHMCCGAGGDRSAAARPVRVTGCRREAPVRPTRAQPLPPVNRK